MNRIPTWQQRAEKHPDHQRGMVTDGMIRARMLEEIADLRAALQAERKWTGLTSRERFRLLCDLPPNVELVEVAKAVEKLLKEKNA